MGSQAFYAIVAGAGPGIGASVARKFASLYPVVLLARKPESYTPIVDEINKSGGTALGISTDVTNAKSVSAAFEQIKAELPGLGLAAAVFNVGGEFVRTTFLELSEEAFSTGYELNGMINTPPVKARICFPVG